MHEDDVEAYLRQFTPRVPSPHVDRSPPRPARWRLAAAAAIVVVCAGAASLWLRPHYAVRENGRVPPPAGPVTSGALHRAALNGPDAFEASLASSERHTLVAVDTSGALLQALAND